MRDNSTASSLTQVGQSCIVDIVMRIAMIGQKGIPVTELGGGVERYVEGLATRLAARGHEVMVYVRPHIVPERVKRYKGVTLVHIPSIPTKHLDTITHTFLATLDVLFQKADVIHYHGVGPSTFAWIPRIFAPRAKVVVTFHSQDRFHKKWGLFARLYLSLGEWTAARIPHATIAVSEIIARYCRRALGAKRVAYIPYAVSVRHTRATDKLKKWDIAPNHYILAVARLVRHKGIHTLIEAYHGVPTDMKLVIVGAPSYTDDYLEYLKTLAAERPNIIFAGFQGGEALAQLFSHAYLYAHPSESEGLSNTILEAMSYGKCAVMSDIPENIAAVDHVGVAFRSGNVHDLRKKLAYLLAHPEVVAHKGSRGREYVARHYDWDTLADKVEALYERLTVRSRAMAPRHAYALAAR